MKKSLLFFAFVFYTLAAGAQGYQSVFGNTQTSWNVFGGDHSFHTDSFYVSGDTVIKSQAYKKVTYVPVTPMGMGSATVFLKEDTATGKVWYRDQLKDTDILIMDMTLAMGDSFNLDLWPYPKVDSVYIENGRKHIRLGPAQFSYTGLHKKLVFIEGVGTNFGITPNTEALLLCMRKDGAKIYTTPMNIPYTRFNECEYFAIRESVEEKPMAVNVKVYPNPAGNEVTVYFNNPGQYETVLEIYNVLGKKIYSSKTVTDSFVINDMAGWPAGVYIHTLTQNGTTVSTGKFVKE